MFGCNFRELLKSFIPDTRSDAYFLLLIFNMLIIFIATGSIAALIVVIVDAILFLVIKAVIYNNEDRDTNKIENATPIGSTTTSSIGSKISSKIPTIV